MSWDVGLTQIIHNDLILRYLITSPKILIPGKIPFTVSRGQDVEMPFGVGVRVTMNPSHILTVHTETCTSENVGVGSVPPHGGDRGARLAVRCMGGRGE